jgi:pyruvate/2-oxoglutarate dehydrogenase complex dihydrolipoamide dehydrogenase (E3) component
MTTTGSQQKTYDLVVVGGGSAGLTAAKLAGKTLKRSVVIVEANRLGGDCTWTGKRERESAVIQATRKQN